MQNKEDDFTMSIPSLTFSKIKAPMENISDELASMNKTLKKKTKKKIRKRTNTKNDHSSKPDPIYGTPNEDLYLLLRSQRYKLSQKNNVPEYVVAPNKTLAKIAEDMPRTKESMMQIKGMGPNRFRLYGRHLLEIVQKFNS